MRNVLIVILVIFQYISCNSNNYNNKLIVFNKSKFLNECLIESNTINLPEDFKLEKSFYSLTHYLLRYSTQTCIVDIKYIFSEQDKDIVFYLDSQKNIKKIYNKENQIIKGQLSTNRYIFAFKASLGFCYIEFKFKPNLENKLKVKVFENYTNSIQQRKTDFIKDIYFDKTIPYIKNIKLAKENTLINRDVDISIFKVIDSNNYLLLDKNRDKFINCDNLFAYYMEIIFPYRLKFKDNDLINIVSKIPKNKVIKRKNILMQLMMRNELKYENENQLITGWFDCTYFSKINTLSNKQ